MCGKGRCKLRSLHREKWAKWPGDIQCRLEELESLGEALRAHHLYPNIVRDLKRREPEDRDWELVWQDLKQNGFPYDRVDLWNNALEWWELSKSS